MSEMTTYQSPLPPSAVVLMDYQTRAVQRLADWVQSADAAFAVAQRLCDSSFVPQQFRGKPIEATAAILAGSEVGISAMAALRAFDIIQGTAAPKAITLRAIVQSFGHEVVLVESTATRCVMKGRRRGTTEWQQSVWTLDRARDLQLTGKDNWKKQPGAMLVARCTSEIARLIAADAILGIGYSAEEVADGYDGAEFTAPAETPDEPQPTTKRMSRKLQAAPDPEPPPADPPADDPADEWQIPDKTRKKLMATYTEAGLTDRDKAIAWTAWAVGHEITSRKDLSEAEASQVIDMLNVRIAERAEATPGQDELA